MEHEEHDVRFRLTYNQADLSTPINLEILSDEDVPRYRGSLERFLLIAREEAAKYNEDPTTVETRLRGIAKHGEVTMYNTKAHYTVEGEVLTRFSVNKNNVSEKTKTDWLIAG